MYTYISTYISIVVTLGDTRSLDYSSCAEHSLQAAVVRESFLGDSSAALRGISACLGCLEGFVSTSRIVATSGNLKPKNSNPNPRLYSPLEVARIWLYNKIPIYPIFYLLRGTLSPKP